MTFYIFHRHRVCLVDRVHVICSLYSWREGFGSSSLVTLPLGFNCGFIFTYACGLSTGVCSWGCPGGLGFAAMRARCGGGAAACVAGVLAAPGTQGSWRLGQQEIQCFRRVWLPVLANTIQDSCLENPTSLTEKPGRPQSTRSQRVGHYWSDPARIDTRPFFACSSSPPVRVERVQLLGLQEPWQHQVCRDTDCLHYRSYGGVFFRASCIWWSESLFGQSFSIAPPVQAHRAAPLAGDLLCSLAHPVT